MLYGYTLVYNRIIIYSTGTYIYTLRVYIHIFYGYILGYTRRRVRAGGSCTAPRLRPSAFATPAPPCEFAFGVETGAGARNVKQLLQSRMTEQKTALHCLSTALHCTALDSRPPLRVCVGFGVLVLGFRIWGFWVLVFGFWVLDFGFMVSGFGFRVSGFGIWVWVIGFRVSGFGV